MATLSTLAGNPAHAIRSNYQVLMGISDVLTLKQTALSLVLGQPGISPKNAKRFEATVLREERLSRLQSYLTNFMLAADGLAVV